MYNPAVVLRSKMVLCRVFLTCAGLCLLVAVAFSAPVKPGGENQSKGGGDLDKAAARVVNGEPVTNKNDYPFVVDLSMHDVAISSTRFCTGTLIAKDIVLTAAHCVLNDGYRSHVYATVGRIELDDAHHDNGKAQSFRTIASIVHPEYEGIGSPNDVALLLLNGTSSAPPVKLAEVTPGEDEEASVVGYGIQMIGTIEGSARPFEALSGRLQKTVLRIKHPDFCSSPDAGIQTAPGMLCTEGVKDGSSACKGDSGGGLFVRRQKSPVLANSTESNANSSEHVQVGIVSYGDSKCAGEDSGVFTDVASVKDWIMTSAERLRKAFEPVQIRLDDGSARQVVNMEGATGARDSKTNGIVVEVVKLYDIHANFSNDRELTVSHCNDGASAYETQLYVSDKNQPDVRHEVLCPESKLSKLSFKVGKDSTFVIGVSGNRDAPYQLSVSPITS